MSIQKNEDTVALRKFREQIKVELGAKDGDRRVLTDYMVDEENLGTTDEGSRRCNPDQADVECTGQSWSWVRDGIPARGQQGTEAGLDGSSKSFYATFLVEIPGKSKTALRRSFRLQGLQPQYGFEDLPSSTRMVKTEASGTPEVFGTNAGPQSHACHIPRNPPTFSG
ncbi:hypothetical protein LAZ67_17001000 [Cordylochernes scorpioides]|uniref:Uncharacterized protein n=1 Tax=Cordylochernes scorpioides TaxID=51811 RepID=A0ABY6LD52_9ARAC|nr:hypothetical protein LAZ67_17001000 [Cordylochernes scorpioides]